MVRCKKKYLARFIPLLLLISLSGCWNYKEVSDLYFVSGYAIDYNQAKDDYHLTVEVASPKVSEAGFELQSLIFQQTGKNCFDAIRNIIPKLGKKLNWSHTKVLILGANVFEKENVIKDIIDFLDRTIETREDLWMLLSKEKTGGEIFSEADSELQPIKSFLLDESFINQKSLPKYEGVPAWKFSQDLFSDAIAATLPAVKLIDVQGKKAPLVWGEGVFKKTELIGWLSGEEIKAKLLVTGNFKGGIWPIKQDKGKQSSMVAIEIKNCKTKTHSIISGNQITMDISINLEAMFVEIGNALDISKKAERKKFEKSAEGQIKNQVRNLIHKAQTKYQSDFFGFGEIIKREHPRLWKTLESYWPEEFAHLKTNVKVDLQFLGASLLPKQREKKP